MTSRWRRERRLGAVAAFTVMVVGATFLWLHGEPEPAGGRIAAAISVPSALGSEDVSGFARAMAPGDVSFPRDHGAHPEFRTEWWYYTGNLDAPDGRHLGFQLTFFRHALAPGTASRGSAWRTTQMYLAHFAVTDTKGKGFFAFARSSRGALGLAGADAEPFHVWLDDWSAQGEATAGIPMRLRAAEDGTAIDLTLQTSKPAVLHGDRGLSPKGPRPGNASYYYSFTRMPARGTVRLSGKSLAVEGVAWMDHEWSTSALGKDLAGWDWFALQLDDGEDMMFYQLRRKDGGADRWSAGTLVDPKGGAHPMARDDVRIEVLHTWQSPRSGITYPARWRLTRAKDDLVVELTPRLADQELIVGPRYWEGAVIVEGRQGSRPIAGRGYVELVGYGDR
ncbi:MAG TPA: lipocalin-like domain-containing protein [Candidatus Methylomirabilis sp.]|nr:lipocalin-like domain-containing protein [Candidatus Methylomirabilis sp.]